MSCLKLLLSLLIFLCPGPKLNTLSFNYWVNSLFLHRPQTWGTCTNTPTLHLYFCTVFDHVVTTTLIQPINIFLFTQVCPKNHLKLNGDKNKRKWTLAKVVDTTPLLCSFWSESNMLHSLETSLPLFPWSNFCNQKSSYNKRNSDILFHVFSCHLYPASL